jgi:hypothetical protein
MATRTTSLALEVVSDFSSAADDLGRIDSAAAAAAGGLDKLQAATDAASGGIDRVAGAADGLDATGGAATGAMGALASGFELIGAEEAAEALQKAALATDFLSGVGQAAALATKAQGAATAVLTGAQTALNVVMAASPLVLIALLVVAVAAAMYLAYQRSETFRDIVDKVGEVAREVFGRVVDFIGNVVDKAGDLIGKAGDIPEGFRTAKEAVVGFMGDMLDPIQNVIDKVQDLIQWIKDIDFPSMPDFNPLNGRQAARGPSYDDMVPSGLGGGTAASSAEVVRLLAAILAALTADASTVADPFGTAQSLRRLLARADRIA